MAGAVNGLSQDMERHFSSRSYGSDVECIFAGIILTGPGSLKLHPVRPLKYRRRYARALVRIDPELPRELRNIFEYDIKPDFELFSQLYWKQARGYLGKQLVESTSIIAASQGKHPNFKVADFGSDLRAVYGNAPKVAVCCG
jgi:hypothetical protein